MYTAHITRRVNIVYYNKACVFVIEIECFQVSIRRGQNMECEPKYFRYFSFNVFNALSVNCPSIAQAKAIATSHPFVSRLPQKIRKIRSRKFERIRNLTEIEEFSFYSHMRPRL